MRRSDLWVPGYRPTLRLRDEKVRCELRDDEHELDLSVTDLRLHRLGNDDSWQTDLDKVKEVSGRIAEVDQLFVSVGLTREFRGRHWLQVNNIHFG